ncbi:uncharacterized protein BO95DRAFT_183048 [Aspergillus brunneoviolaceus CBS 621.78]|uniref:Uncharacterized protein n=1 Tax=Aspergillus brunneoviolaceus CBS 621.78 TaxID=1450534 RepID=A0ACD1G4W5_9EURO|nr:hypothetical protein BO95DRAFT_183048 [Aspergillus brunneoviolaceus CBS 621.78]RAH44275.1 hypothetical protein BO95DRAFT_183048 [Aspergillus brunneoviolaceus CBS 621.78]
MGYEDSEKARTSFHGPTEPMANRRQLHRHDPILFCGMHVVVRFCLLAFFHAPVTGAKMSRWDLPRRCQQKMMSEEVGAWKRFFFIGKHTLSFEYMVEDDWDHAGKGTTLSTYSTEARGEVFGW